MDLQIGFANGILRGNDHTEYFYGMIDDVRLYSRVRRGEIRGARRPRPCHYPWRHSIPEAPPPIGNRPISEETPIGGHGFPSPAEQRAGAHPRAAHAPQSEKESWPRNWANFSFFWLCSDRDAWVNLHLLGQPNTLLAQVLSHKEVLSLYHH